MLINTNQRVRRQLSQDPLRYQYGTVADSSEHSFSRKCNVLWDGSESPEVGVDVFDIEPVEVEGITMPVCPRLDCQSAEFSIPGSTRNGVPVFKCVECYTTYTFDSITGETTRLDQELKASA